MRTRTYIALALLLGTAAIGTIWFGIDQVTQEPQGQATAADGEFQPANVDDVEAKADEPRTPQPAEEHAETERDDDAQPRVIPTETTVEIIRPGQSRSKKERREWSMAILQIVTNFEKADVSVNGLPYPEYTPEGEEEGMVLPAGGPHIVQVTYDGKDKTYQVHLRPDETRILMVELSGLKGSTGGSRTQARKPSPKKDDTGEEDKKDGVGRVTVYSKPNGTVLVDGSQTDEKTPGTVEVEPGRHDIQVKFDNGDVSEKKIIRVRKDSRIKLFFRQRD